MAHITDILTTLITNLYLSTGLAGIVLAMAIESCCIPLPSEVVIPIAGLLLAKHQLLPGTNPLEGIILIGLAGAVGCLIGSIAAYGIGYKGGRPLMLKYGRYVLISQHDADLADRFFQRWGSMTAFFSRLLPAVRSYISLPAGITKMPFGKFCVYSFLGSVPWCILLAYAGVVLGNNMAVIEPYYKGFEYVIIALIVVLVVLYLWRHIRNDRRARAEHAAAETVAQQQPQSINGMPPYQQQQQSINGMPPYQQQQPVNGMPPYQQQQQPINGMPPYQQQQPPVNGMPPYQQWNQTPPTPNWQQPQGPSQPQPPRR